MEIALRWLPIMVSLGRISFRVVRFAGMRLRQRRDLDHAGLADKDVVAAAVDGDPGLHDHVAVAAGRGGMGAYGEPAAHAPAVEKQVRPAEGRDGNEGGSTSGSGGEQ